MYLFCLMKEGAFAINTNHASLSTERVQQPHLHRADDRIHLTDCQKLFQDE